MAEIKGGNLTADNRPSLPDTQDVSELNERLGKLASREGDEVDSDEMLEQLVIAVQVLLPPLSKLESAESGTWKSGSKEPGFRVGKRESRSLLKTDLKNADSIKPHISSISFGEVWERSVPKPQYFNLPGPTSASHLKGMVNAGQVAAIRQDLESRSLPTTVQTFRNDHRGPHSVHDEDPGQVRPVSTEQLSREITQKNAQPQRTVSPATRAEATQVLMNAKVQSPGDSAWVYNFRTWGKQHAVFVSRHNSNIASHVPLISTLLQPTSLFSTSLQPTSLLVEQRLHDYKEASDHVEQWNLKDPRDQQEQRNRNQHGRDNDEEER